MCTVAVIYKTRIFVYSQNSNQYGGNIVLSLDIDFGEFGKKILRLLECTGVCIQTYFLSAFPITLGKVTTDPS